MHENNELPMGSFRKTKQQKKRRQNKCKTNLTKKQQLASLCEIVNIV